MPWFDFVIADRYVVPDEQRIYFKEKVLAVDGCFLPLSKTERSSHVSTRKELGLPESAFVMASFGNSYKINPALVDSWFNILKRVDSAVLWLTHDNEAATKNLKDYAKASNIDLERLIFTPRVSLEAYRCNIKLADVFLDIHVTFYSL
jgi:predicted O-linked N-acetylglucosamine transferase (SPINDLY family)